MEGFRIAAAFVQVSPDTEGFKEELKAKLDEALAGAGTKAKVGLDTTELDAGADKAKAKVDELGGKTARPKVSLDDAGAAAKIDEIRARLDRLGADDPSPKVRADISDAEAKAASIEARIDRLNSIIARPEVTPQMADAQAKIDALQAKLEELGKKEESPKVTADIAAAQAQIDALKAKLEELQSKDTQVRVKASADLMQADAQLDRLLVKLSEMDAKEAHPKLGLDDEDFNAKLDKDKAKLSAFGSGGEGGGLAGALAGGIGALMPGIGGAASGLGLLGATGALAFGGIAKALSSAHQASQNVGQTGAQLAATQFSNSVAVQNAQQAVGQAHQQAAQDAITSARSIESAQMNLASVERGAAESQVQALESVTRAQQGVEEADYSLTEAQYNLNQAWERAREEIRQLDDQLADSKLSVQSAQLAIQQALYQQRLTDQNAYSTQLDREQAALAVARAQQQLTDAQDQETNAAYAANLAHKQGVAGSQTVVQAKQAVTAATYGQQDAHTAAADAQRQLTLTELNNAAQIKQAQQSVAAAAEQAAYQRMRDAEQVQNAEQNLTNTIKQQQLQAAATASTENQAANQFAKDMANLTPAGRALVDQILGMKGAFKQLEAAAQNAVAPGLTLFLQGIQTLLPSIQSGVTKMGGAISSAFGDLGKELSKPAAAHVLDGLINNGLQFAKIVVPAFGGFIGKLGEIGAKKGAADGLANLLAGIAKGLTGMADAIGKNEGPINQFLTAAGTIIAQIGPPLGQIVGLVAKALEPLTRYLNAHPNGTVVKVIGDVIAGMITLKGLAKVLPDFITGPLGKIGGKIADLVTSPLKKLGGKIGGLLTSPFKAAAGKIPGLMSKAWDGLGTQAIKAGLHVQSGLSKVSGFFTETLPGSLSKGGGALKTFASNGVTVISGWGSKVGSAMGGAASAVGQFVAGFGRQLATAAKATVAWIAEHSTAAATFIAENVTMAASATAAFIAENAATLGIVAGIGLLVTGILYLATHWKQVWHDIEVAAMWLWHNVLDPMWQGIEKGAEWLYNVGIKPYFELIKFEFKLLEQAGMWLWHNVFDPLWQGIEAGARGFVSGFRTVWNTLENVFKTPVNFLIEFVYTKGIESLWNGVVKAIGMNSLKLPDIPQLAAGGVIPGYAPGQDTVPAILSPGEGVLVPEAVRAIGPGTVDSLNAAYGGGRTSSGGHFAGGGIVEIAKITAALATGNGGALTNALDSLVGTKAVGDFAKMLIGVPKTLISDAVKAVLGMFGGGGSGGGGGVIPTGQHLQIIDQALAAAGVPPPGTKAQWEAGLNTLIGRESSWNPRAINLTDSNAAAGDPSRGLGQAIMSTFLAYHAPGTSMDIYDPVANVASIARYIVARYGNITNVQQANASMAPKGYDSGGWLMPGDMPVNGLRKPEAVLTPAESEAFVQIVRRLTAQGVGGSALGSKEVNIYFTGTQYPTVEQMSAIKRDMALALGGG
jgi:hypothetical protein